MGKTTTRVGLASGGRLVEYGIEGKKLGHPRKEKTKMRNAILGVCLKNQKRKTRKKQKKRKIRKIGRGKKKIVAPAVRNWWHFEVHIL